ncbi:hypothetical protein KBC70_03825 [Candidatus Woesebacteria bacterium]|nr:hypothetical protein [Candidatus Woesebacteria bacterium]
MGENGDSTHDGINPDDRFRSLGDPRRSEAEQAFGKLKQAKPLQDDVLAPSHEGASTISAAEQKILDELIADLPEPDRDALAAEARSKLLLDGCLTSVMKKGFTGTAFYSFIVAGGTLIQHGEPNRAMFYSGLGLLALIGKKIAQSSFEAKRDKVIDQITHKLNR